MTSPLVKRFSGQGFCSALMVLLARAVYPWSSPRGIRGVESLLHDGGPVLSAPLALSLQRCDWLPLPTDSSWVFFFWIEVKLTYNIILVSGGQHNNLNFYTLWNDHHSESVTSVTIDTIFFFFLCWELVRYTLSNSVVTTVKRTVWHVSTWFCWLFQGGRSLGS